MAGGWRGDCLPLNLGGSKVNTAHVLKKKVGEQEGGGVGGGGGGGRGMVVVVLLGQAFGFNAEDLLCWL